MKSQLLYKDLAKYYDLLYSNKDYKKEANTLNKLISKYKKSKDKELLEVACGTGKHLQYFKKKYSCTGLDLNQGILNIAKKRAKGVKFKKGNMINFKLNKKFDVITCLFSSIGYVKTYKNLQKTINNFSKHLKEGGVVIIEPWFTKETFIAGSPHITTYEGKDIKIARLNVSKVKGNTSILNMHYLVAERNKDVKYFSDSHDTGMFDTNKTLEYMKKAGLKAKFLKHGLLKNRGLFIGVKV